MPVVVLERVEDAAPLGQALYAGGLPAAEVTLRTPAAAASIHAMAEACPELLIGAGTVLDLAQCKRAVEAGAHFIVSPGTNLETVDWCLEHEVPVIPAAVTPTEIMTLIAPGISVTKFFPANLYGGLDGIQALSAVFGEHRFMPTGGVNAQNMRSFLKEPAVIAVGGTWMVKPTLFADGSFDRVQTLAKKAASIRDEVRIEGLEPNLG